MTYFGVPIGLFSAFKAVHTTDRTNRRFDTIETLLKRNNELTAKLTETIEKANSNKEVNVTETQIEAVRKSQEIIKEQLRDLTSKINESTAIQSDQINKVNEEIQNINNIQEEIIEIITKSDGTNFLDYNIIDLINNFLSNLSVSQTVAFAHINCSLAIFFSLTTILSIFYGEKFIEYFSLETKYPKIAKFIQLRRKFQQYYLLLHFTIIVSILIALTYLDILVFLHH